MARRPRLFAPGLHYHVMARGNRREAVFQAPEDYALYLRLLARYLPRYAVTLLAYCLMPNHVHLVARTTQAPLGQFMQGLQQSYTQRFNRRYEQVGHVFQGRYKALPCTSDEYLLTLLRYVHLNPVRAGLTADPAAYPYSSHEAYVSARRTELVDPHPMLGLVGGPEGYARLTAGPAGNDDSSEAPGPVAPAPCSESTARHRLSHAAESVDASLARVAGALGIDVSTLRGPDRSRRATRARALAAWVLVRRIGYRVGDVASALSRDGATLTVVIGRLGTSLASDPELERELGRVANCMEVKA